MHSLFAGFMGFFMGITSFFHGGQGMPAHSNQQNTVQQTNLFGTPGMMRGRGRMNLPAGERPFFGTVTAINGQTVTLQMQMGMRRGATASPSITPASSRTVTLNLDSSTTYIGGSQTDIATNTKLAGIGKTNSDGSITAIKVQINPTMPSGFPRRNRNPNIQNNQY